MPELNQFVLDISPEEIVRWVKEAEQDQTNQRHFLERVWKVYVFEEDFDSKTFGVHGDEGMALVVVEAMLDIVPSEERDFWLLQVKVRAELGLRHTNEKENYASSEISLDAFQAEFLGSGKGTATVTVSAKTSEARAHFDRWFAAIKTKHRN